MLDDNNNFWFISKPGNGHMATCGGKCDILIISGSNFVRIGRFVSFLQYKSNPIKWQQLLT